jgi:hypothetical protein
MPSELHLGPKANGWQPLGAGGPCRQPAVRCGECRRIELRQLETSDSEPGLSLPVTRKLSGARGAAAQALT